MTSFIITLTGASGSGKSYITDKILEYGNVLRNSNIEFYPIQQWKYVTRNFRESEIIEMVNKKSIDVKSVKSIPKDCEFIYQTYGDEYGFRKKDLQELLNDGKSPIIVVNDIRVIEEMKKEFPNQVLSLFIFREIIPLEETHIKTGNFRGGISSDKIKLRFEKAVSLYRIYIENIYLFDRTILNIPNEITNLNIDIAKIQIERIVNAVIEKKIKLNKVITKKPKLFIISGNAQSGKDDIIRAAKKMGKLETDILVKYTNRWSEEGDAGEIECKYIPKSKLIQQYKIEYDQDKKVIEETDYYKFINSNIKKFKLEYEERKEFFKNYEEYLKVKFELEKYSKLNELKNSHERFWFNLNLIIKRKLNSSIYKNYNEVLLEEDYNKILKKYFELNPNYIDLDFIIKENKKLYLLEIKKINQRIKKKKENKSGCLLYKGKPFLIYENNKKIYNKSIYYGFEIDKYKNQLKNSNNHLLLIASLPNIFKICRENFGKDDIVTAFAYSQISKQEHLLNTNGVTGVAKIQEYDDILRYANHIDDFDYAFIYAETSIVNKTGSQKDELVDQMFRLFRVYNEEPLVNSNKLYVLAGPSATGKSTILSKIINEGLCKQAPKFSNRENRITLGGVIDDIVSVPEKCINEFCKDVNYKMYGNLYGFNIDKIRNDLNSSNLITICSDIESIKKLKNNFSNNFSAVFIYLDYTSVENLVKAFFERKGYTIENNLIILASKLSDTIKNENLLIIKKECDVFKNKIKEFLSEKDSNELIQRFNSLLNSKEYYEKNKELFNHTISGSCLEELFEQSIYIIKKNNYD